MIESQNIRQILAIMVTDIVDYTETMNNDEAKAWEYLKKQRTIIPPTVSRMNGQTFKEMGDGTFSKFRSAIDAVQCAVKIQEGAKSNDLSIRIAIHLGEVMDDGFDVIGTGVNIASRIQQLAIPGGIVISDDIWRQIRNQPEMEGRSIGEQDIKGYHKSIEVYELTYNPDGSVTQKVKVTETVTIIDEEGKKVKAEKARQEFIKKVAIFPFDYNGEKEDKNWLQYGLPYGTCISLLQDEHIDLQFPNGQELGYTAFSKKLRSIGYEDGTNVPLALRKKIANEIHCDFFIIGNISNDDANKVSTKLYNTENGKLISEIEINDNNIFNIIDKISMFHRKEMGIPKSHIESTTNLSSSELITEFEDAYENNIKGILKRQYENDSEESISFLQKAMQIDPNYCLGACSLWNSAFGGNKKENQALCENTMKTAIRNIYRVPDRLKFRIKIGNYQWQTGESEKAKKIAEMWIAQYPDSLEPYRYLADILHEAHDFQESIKVWEKVLLIDPHYYSAYHEISNLFCHHLGGKYEKALEYAEKYLEKCPTEAKSYHEIADIHFTMGNYTLSKEYYEKAFMIDSDNSNYMIGMAKSDLNLYNYSDAQEQLEEALSLCKGPRDYYNVHEAYVEYYDFRGQIQLLIEHRIKKVNYAEEFVDEIDLQLNRIFQNVHLCRLNQVDNAIKGFEKIVDETIEPWNFLVAGMGGIIIGGIAEQEKLVIDGIEKIKKFQKIKKWEFISIFTKIGQAYIYFLNEKYNETIKDAEEVIYINTQYSYIMSQLILKSYNKQKDFLNAKKVGKEHLIKCENKPLILLEIAKAHLGLDENDKANEYLTKLLGIWEEADEEYIYYQEAKKLWKELNIEKAAIA